MGPRNLYLSATPLISGIQLQIYRPYFPVLRQQLATIDDVNRYSKPCAQHHLWPLSETASFYHLNEVGVDDFPFRPMRIRHGHEVDNEVNEMAGRQCGYEGEQE